MSDGPDLDDLQQALAAARHGVDHLDKVREAEAELEQATSKIAIQIDDLLPSQDLKVMLDSAVYTFRRVKIPNYTYAGTSWNITTHWSLIRDNALLAGNQLNYTGKGLIENGKHFCFGKAVQQDTGVRARFGAAEKLTWATPEQRLAFTHELPQLCEELAQQVPGKAVELRRLGQSVGRHVAPANPELT